MQVVLNPQTVADFIQSLKTGGLTVNRDYQRGGGIWPSSAKSALIETMILKYPMPALYVHQRFDKETRKPFREIVDGQQRTDAILAFAENKLRMSKTLPTERLRGKKFSELDADDQFAFLTYSLPIFLFTDTTEAEVREAFRRINSHTSVLNPEEKRHSTFQGPLKWFVVALTKELQMPLLEWGVFNRSQLNRMRDAWMISEILYAMEYGIQTTKAEHLDRLYAKYEKEDVEMPFGDTTKADLLDAISVVGSWDWLTSSPFTKPYHFMILLLAVMHVRKAISPLEAIAPGGRGLRSTEEISERMAELIRALDYAEEAEDIHDGDVEANETEGTNKAARSGVSNDSVRNNMEGGIDGTDKTDGSERALEDPILAAHAEFVKASSGKTNTEESRRVRFGAFCWALSK